MVKSRLFVTLIATAALTATLVVAGCHGGGPSGAYTDTTGRMTMEFKDGKVFLNMGGMADPEGTPYDVNGDKITIHYAPDSILGQFSVLTINSDGTLQGPMGILKKK
ncbi:MAG TPA: hypothetical protein VIX59_10645 [Candidatus Binataceae bacterium]